MTFEYRRNILPLKTVHVPLIVRPRRCPKYVYEERKRELEPDDLRNLVSCRSDLCKGELKLTKRKFDLFINTTFL